MKVFLATVSTYMHGRFFPRRFAFSYSRPTSGFYMVRPSYLNFCAIPYNVLGISGMSANIPAVSRYISFFCFFTVLVSIYQRYIFSNRLQFIGLLKRQWNRYVSKVIIRVLLMNWYCSPQVKTHQTASKIKNALLLIRLSFNQCWFKIEICSKLDK